MLKNLIDKMNRFFLFPLNKNNRGGRWKETPLRGYPRAAPRQVSGNEDAHLQLGHTFSLN